MLKDGRGGGGRVRSLVRIETRVEDNILNRFRTAFPFS